MIGEMSSTVRRSRHIPRWTPKITKKLVWSSVGGRAFAFRKMRQLISLLREVYGRSVDLTPGMISFEGCEGLFAHLKGKGKLDSAFWLPALGHPTDCFTKVKSDIGPLLILTESI